MMLLFWVRLLLKEDKSFYEVCVSDIIYYEDMYYIEGIVYIWC